MKPAVDKNVLGSVRSLRPPPGTSRASGSKPSRPSRAKTTTSKGSRKEK